MKRALLCMATVLCVVLCAAGCDLRSQLAQSELFADYRASLIDECCTCLSRRGTGDATASCVEAVLIDGRATLPAGATVGNGERGNDFNDEVDEGEIPCLCDTDHAGCVEALHAGTDIVIPGACVDQLNQAAPCESACAGVLNFSPVLPP